MAENRPFHNPFAALAGLPGVPAPVAPAPASVPPAQASAPAAEPRIARAVVRLERSGRGGKEVTVIEQLTLNAKERESWLKALKAGLGCGGVIEGDALVLQGDHRKRLPPLLTARGVKRVTVS